MGQDVFDDTLPEEQISLRGDHLWVEGVHISFWDCPECLRYTKFSCPECRFFVPSTCRLLNDLIAIFGDYRERQAVRRRIQQRFILALCTELQAHGRPLHYTVLAQIVADRYPGLQVSEVKVLSTMSFHPELFEKTDEGVYQTRKND